MLARSGEHPAPTPQALPPGAQAGHSGLIDTPTATTKDVTVSSTAAPPVRARAQPLDAVDPPGCDRTSLGKIHGGEDGGNLGP
ncbi:hypothetical protein MANAM107_04320 [Actinomyces capricornis]|uniref:Uncharacterized protein n=1 Tax=Actinomyces capricornis TaxID=2755559 RepID=A0ABM7U887_9ACTO|nr:hypothetical protein MANAM107_04320 [Actinomyces capricornis]